jgi:hypothetical protein
MTKPFFAALTIAALGTAASTAYAGGNGYTTGPGWGCLDCGYKNGTQLTGLAFEISAIKGIELTQRSEADPLVVLAEENSPADHLTTAAASDDAPSNDGQKLQFQLQGKNNTFRR